MRMAGLPIALHVTAGQEADCSNYDALMEARDSDPAIMLGDKDYDSNPIRQNRGLPRCRHRALAPRGLCGSPSARGQRTDCLARLGS